MIRGPHHAYSININRICIISIASSCSYDSAQLPVMGKVCSNPDRLPDHTSRGGTWGDPVVRIYRSAYDWNPRSAAAVSNSTRSHLWPWSVCLPIRHSYVTKEGYDCLFHNPLAALEECHGWGIYHKSHMCM